VEGYEDEKPETNEEPETDEEPMSPMSPPGLMRSNTICIPETDEEPTMSLPRLVRSDTVIVDDDEQPVSKPRLMRTDTVYVPETDEQPLSKPRLMRTDTVYVPETDEELPSWFLPPGLMRPDTVVGGDDEQRDFILPNGELWSWTDYHNERLQSGAVSVDDDEQRRDRERESLWPQPRRVRSDAMVEDNNELPMSAMSLAGLLRTQSTTEQVDLSGVRPVSPSGIWETPSNDAYRIPNPLGMDRLNLNAMEALNNGGIDNMIAHMFTNHDEGPNNNQPLTYAEMRSRYG